MARKRRNELATGMFVILALTTLVGVIVWMGGGEIFRPTKQKVVFFLAEIAGSAGLETGNFVQIGDDQIGRIADIRFEPLSGRTLYTAEIDRDDFEVHSDGNAIVVAGLIGGARLVITHRGSDSAPLADDENPIELFGGINQTMADLASAAKKVNEIAGSILNEFDANQANAILPKVRKVIGSLESAAAKAAQIAANIQFETTQGEEKAAMGKIHRSIDHINKITADAQPKISDTLSAARDTIQQIRKYAKDDIAEILTTLRQSNTELLKITKDFSTVSAHAKEIIVLHRDNIDEIIDNMAQVSANLKAASKEIRRNPWRLIYKPDGRELHSQNIYDAARAFSNGAEQLDQAIAKMTLLSKASIKGIPSDDPMLLKVRKQLEEAFGKFTKAEQALWKELNQ